MGSRNSNGDGAHFSPLFLLKILAFGHFAAVAGHYNDVHIVQLSTMTVVQRLRADNAADWHVAMAAIDLSNANGV